MAKKIILYSTQECQWCHKTREFFKQYKIKFKDINVGEDKKALEEMVKKSGQQGVPVVDIDGKIIVGYDEEELKKLVKIK
ncbi:MAG: glutaredoxin domain-containing protein [Nanoarchaeota archaeon]